MLAPGGCSASEPRRFWHTEARTRRPGARAAYDRCGSGTGSRGLGRSSSTVTGEPGVGKSRLTEAAREHAEANGFQWLQTRCLSYGAGLAYWPYADLVRTVADIDPRAGPEESPMRSARRTDDVSAVPYFARLLGLRPANDEVVALEPEAFRRGLHDAFASWLRSSPPTDRSSLRWRTFTGRTRRASSSRGSSLGC